MSETKAFDLLKGRYCIAAIVIAWYWQPGAGALARATGHAEPYWLDVIDHYYGTILLAIFLLAALWVSRLDYRELVGRAPERRDIRAIALTVLLTFCASSAIVVFTFVPLSYIFPTFVTWWLRWAFSPIIYISADGTFPIAANLLNLLSLVVLGPILEEAVFRGYLLHRWSLKWGLGTGVTLSSALFGALHPDPIAAMVTGFGFALLYLKTQSLWNAIFAHGTYNLVVWLQSIEDTITDLSNYPVYALDQFQASWWWGVLQLIVVLIIMDRLLRRDAPLGPFVLPQTDGRRQQ